MNPVTSSSPRCQTLGEELANSLSHGLALLLALGALPVLVVGAVRDGGAAGIVGASVFGTTMVLLYLASTLYHALPTGRVKRVFLILDHCAIFLLIAGTYTPFVLGTLEGSWGWSLFGVVWGLALSGIVLKAAFGARYQLLSTAIYLAMGWLIVVAAHPLLRNIEPAGLYWLVGGGLAYTAGVLFFALDDRIRFAHFVWHVFVVTGTACHFVAVYNYAA
ncbi:MAG: PAQR family membrane homeostasis protein TrhA [Gammaproteobacteria bacterium]